MRRLRIVMDSTRVLLSLALLAGGAFADATDEPANRPPQPVERTQDGVKHEAPPPIPPISAPDSAARKTDPAIAALVPGALPADTAPLAQAAWERTCKSRFSSTEAGAAQRVSAFDLQIDVRQRSADNQTNDSPKPVRYRYLSPGFVRVTTASGREHVRGPQGDFFIDRDRHEVHRLDATSRENAEDLRQINESVGIAQNFIALTDPASLRIASLKLLPGPPASLPAAVKNRFNDAPLQWLDVRTPDFHLVASTSQAAAPAPSFVRVSIGADPKSGEVEVALVDVDSSAPTPSSSAVLIELANYAAIDGFRMPQLVKVYRVDEVGSPRAFRPEPTTTLGVLTKSASLRAQLKPQDFEPG